MSESVIPLSVFQLDCPVPPCGWDRLFESEGVELLEDDIGRTCIGREDARRLLGAIRAEEAFRADEQRRRDAERERQMRESAARIPRGIPALAGMTAAETLFASDPDERQPSVFTELLDAELAAGKGA